MSAQRGIALVVRDVAYTAQVQRCGARWAARVPDDAHGHVEGFGSTRAAALENLHEQIELVMIYRSLGSRRASTKEKS